MIQVVDNYQTYGNDTKSYYFNFDGNKTQVNKDKKTFLKKLK